jgi:hypothetical protein
MVAFWLAVEAIFYVFYYRPRYAELSAQPGPKHRPATEDAWAAFYRVLRYFKETHGSIDYEMYYSGWFMGAKFEDIKRGASPWRHEAHGQLSAGGLRPTQATPIAPGALPAAIGRSSTRPAAESWAVFPPLCADTRPLLLLLLFRSVPRCVPCCRQR